MTRLSIAALAVGIVAIAVNLPAFLAPAKFRAWATAFPRSATPAWILAAIDIFWVAWIVYHASLGRFDILKPGIFLAAPVLFFLVVQFMDELLAPRALGGLLMLAADPLLDSARWHPSAWRFAITIVAYLWAIAGIVLMLYPYRLRQWTERLLRSDGLCRLLGAVRIAVGVLLIALAFTKYAAAGTP